MSFQKGVNSFLQTVVTKCAHFMWLVFVCINTGVCKEIVNTAFSAFFDIQPLSTRGGSLEKTRRMSAFLSFFKRIKTIFFEKNREKMFFSIFFEKNRENLFSQFVFEKIMFFNFFKMFFFMGDGPKSASRGLKKKRYTFKYGCS